MWSYHSGIAGATSTWQFSSWLGSCALGFLNLIGISQYCWSLHMHYDIASTEFAFLIIVRPPANPMISQFVKHGPAWCYQELVPLIEQPIFYCKSIFQFLLLLPSMDDVHCSAYVQSIWFPPWCHCFSPCGSVELPLPWPLDYSGWSPNSKLLVASVLALWDLGYSLLQLAWSSFQNMEASSYDALVTPQGSQLLLLVTMVCCTLIQERVQLKCGGLICSQPCLPPIQGQSVQMTLCIDISFDALQLRPSPWPSFYSYAVLVQLTTSLIVASGILPKLPWVSFPSGEWFSVECKCHIQCGSLQYVSQLLPAVGELGSNCYVSIVACVLRKLSSSFSEVHSIDAEYGPSVGHSSIVPLAWDPGAESIIHDQLLPGVTRSFQYAKLFQFMRYTTLAIAICRYAHLHKGQQLGAMIWCWNIVPPHEGVIFVFHLFVDTQKTLLQPEVVYSPGLFWFKVIWLLPALVLSTYFVQLKRGGLSQFDSLLLSSIWPVKKKHQLLGSSDGDYPGDMLLKLPWHPPVPLHFTHTGANLSVLTATSNSKPVEVVELIEAATKVILLNYDQYHSPPSERSMKLLQGGASVCPVARHKAFSVHTPCAVLWDPGDLHFQIPVHWLEGKPILKEEGMSVVCQVGPCCQVGPGCQDSYSNDTKGNQSREGGIEELSEPTLLFIFSTSPPTSVPGSFSFPDSSASRSPSP